MKVFEYGEKWLPLDCNDCHNWMQSSRKMSFKPDKDYPASELDDGKSRNTT